MKEARIMLPDLLLVAGTRVLLGTGLGLLLADRLPASRRRTVGWLLFLGGAASTLPLARKILGHTHTVAGPTDAGTWRMERTHKAQ